MDAGEVVSDRQLLSDFIRSFMELTAANIDAQTKALETLRALAEPAFYECDAIAANVQVEDRVLSLNNWSVVTLSEPCDDPYSTSRDRFWHLRFDTETVDCVRRDCPFRVRRPRGERAA